MAIFCVRFSSMFRNALLLICTISFIAGITISAAHAHVDNEQYNNQQIELITASNNVDDGAKKVDSLYDFHCGHHCHVNIIEYSQNLFTEIIELGFEWGSDKAFPSTIFGFKRPPKI